MRCLLRWKFFVDTLQLFSNVGDLLAGHFALLSIQFHGRPASQSPMRAVHHRGHHLQIA
jgi:hypothetical protein